MTPDERLREAVKNYLAAIDRRYAEDNIENRNRSLIMRSMLRDAYKATQGRPCINAAVEVERKPWWRFW